MDAIEQLTNFVRNATAGVAFTGAGNYNSGAIIADGGSIEMSGDLENAGQINVTDGTFRAGGPVANVSVGETTAGTISGRGNTTLRFDGGLENGGVLGVAFAEAVAGAGGGYDVN